MGEISEMVLDGTICQVCGEFIDDEPPGYPCTCHACLSRSATPRDHKPPDIAKVKCQICGKKVKHNGLADHQRDAHYATKFLERFPELK